MKLDTAHIRQQFPTLATLIKGKPVVYLDSAATALMTEACWTAMREFEEHARANVHRGMHVLAERATDAYEDARKTVQKFVGAKHAQEIVFTKNSTESINLIARSFGEMLQRGDRVLVTQLEHHSNVVPWLQLKERSGIAVDWIEIDERGNLQMEQYAKLLAAGGVKLVAVTGQSNVLGVRPDLKKMITMAHEAGARLIVDAAQLAPHHQIDVVALDCDALMFSGHKVYGPTGIGVLYAKREMLEAMPPFLGGGMMIHTVEQSGFTPADIPQKFEAGTPPIAQAVGLAAAIEWLTQFSWKEIEAHERDLLAHARTTLEKIDGVTVLGPKDGSGCISFTVKNVHPHDLTDVIGREGICLRAGHHCTQPLHAKLGVPATARLSVGIYNTKEDIDRCTEALSAAIRTLQ
jgi:cysteine desulfurase/selenocysteine lyase